MRRFRQLVVLACACGLISPLLAAETPKASDKPALGVGQLVIQDAQSGAPVRLNIARYHVSVVLQPPVALVQIDQAFYNPFERQEEGTFVFNLPRGASVSRFAMYVAPKQLIEGELVERARGNEIYQSIVSARRDPAILEQVGDNLFKMRVFPIFARDIKRILLDYTLPLETVDGECSFRMPLLSDLEPIWDFRLSFALPSAVMAGDVKFPSHPITWRTPQGVLTGEFQKQNCRPETDFVVSFKQPPGHEPTLRSYVAEPLPPRREEGVRRTDDPEGRPQMYFQISIPPLPGPAAAAKTEDALGKQAGTMPADVLVLADTSSGMRKCRELSAAVEKILRGLRPGDRFRLMGVDAGARQLHEGWYQGGKDTDKALARFGQEFFLGETDLAAGIQESLKSFEPQAGGRRRLVVYIGDGEDTVLAADSKDRAAAAARALGQAEAALIGVIVRGGVQDLSFFEHLGRESGGLVFDLAGSATGPKELAVWLGAGLPHPEPIVSVSVEGAKAADVFHPTTWYPGRPLDVFGRKQPSKKLQVNLTVRRGNKPLHWHWDMEVPEQDDVFVGRLWAQCKLDRLRRRPPGAEISDAQRQRIVALSQEWSLLSPYTAFLVLESEQEYARYEIDRQQRRRYWKPAGVREQSAQPPEWWLTRADWAARQSQRESREAASEKSLAHAVRSAQQALEAGNPWMAQRMLDQVKESRGAERPAEYRQLALRVAEQIQRQVQWESLGLRRGLFDPRVGLRQALAEPSLSPLLAMPIAGGEDFRRRHPFAGQLLQPVQVKPHTSWVEWARIPEGDPFAESKSKSPQNETKQRISFQASGFRLKDLVAMLRARTGLNVVLDQRAVSDAGIDMDSGVDVHGWGQMSLASYARFALAQQKLALIEEPYRLLITSQEEAEQRMTTDVYPLDDLLFTERVAHRGLLVHPYADAEETARERIREKLRRPMTLNNVDRPLRTVLEELARALNDTVVIDRTALEEAGVAMDTPCKADWRDVPAGVSLGWLLQPLGLTYLVQGEALVITTPEEADKRPVIRLHSARGLLHEPFGRLRRPPMRMDAGGMGAVGLGGGGSFGGGFGMGGMGFGEGGGGGAGGRPRSFPGIARAGLFDDSEPEVSSVDAESDAGSRRQDPPLGEGMGLMLDVVQSQGAMYDADSVVDMVTSMIAPSSWEEVGGPGSICFVPQTMDFVFSQTEEVHEQTEALLDRLRRMPVLGSDKGGWRPAKVHPVRPGDPVDFDSLIEAITSTVRPEVWDEVGGPCSLATDEPRAALVVSADQQTHDDLYHLLVMLRRSRYTALRSDRPWEAAPAAPDRPLVCDWGLPSGAAMPLLARLPDAGPEELAVLAMRALPEDRLWQWRRSETETGRQQEILVRRQGERLEIRLDRCIVRTEGDLAAVAWPELGMVEIGNWGEGLRQVIDIMVPWLPYRSNRELARLFEISSAGPHRLRLAVPGSGPRAETRLEIEFQHGAPRVCESYVQDRLTGRVRLAGQVEKDKAGEANTIVFEDAAGKVLVRWEPISSGGTADARAPLPREAIPELTAGWDGYVLMDRRSKQPSPGRRLVEAVESIHRADWPLAHKRLDETLKLHPRHPLALLLKAWCWEHEPGVGSDPPRRQAIVDALREVATNRTTTLTRFIGAGHFASLRPNQLHTILLAQPPDTRAAADWDQLARAAIAAELFKEALEHTREALAKGANEDRQFSRRLMEVELLLRLEQSKEAVEVARRWASMPGATPEDLASMAELLADFGLVKEARELFVLSLWPKDLAPPRRYVLLRRAAETEDVRHRCDLLLEAASLMPARAEERSECLGLLTAELLEPEVAGELAACTKDAHLKARLLVRQAELTRDGELKGELYWQVHQLGELIDEDLETAVETWNGMRQPQRVIEAVEAQLRSGKDWPSPSVIQGLEAAYRAAGRPSDARRAATSDPEPRAPGQPALPPRTPQGPTGFF